MTEFGLFGKPDEDVVKSLKWARENPEEWSRKVYGERKSRRGLHVRVNYCMIDNDEWRKSNRNELGLWLYLCSYIVRKPLPNDKYDIYHRYYCEGKLACFISIRKIAKDFGYKNNNLSQVERWVSSLLEKGAFIKEEIDVGKPKKQTVYILGELKTIFNDKEDKNETTEVLYYNNQFK